MEPDKKDFLARVLGPDRAAGTGRAKVDVQALAAPRNGGSDRRAATQ